jgi:hypothetical protein
MGRFYKTSKGNYIDFVYKQPNSLLLKAVQTADARIDKQIATNADLYGKLHQEALTPDVTKRNEILAGYKQNIDDVAEDIRTNPLDYLGGPSTKIRKLTNDISQNLLRGELAAIGANHAARAKYKEKLEADKNHTAAEVSKLLQNYDAKFAHDLKTGKRGTAYGGPSDYRSYTGQYLDPNVEIFDYVDKRGAGWQSDIITNMGWYPQTDKNGNEYLVTKKGGVERVDPEIIRKTFSDAIASDPTIMKAWQSRIREGVYTPKQVKDMYSSAVNYAVNKFGFTKDKRQIGVSENAYGLQRSADLLKNPAITTTVSDKTSAVNAQPGNTAEETNVIRWNYQEGINKMINNTKSIVSNDLTDAIHKEAGVIKNPNYSPSSVDGKYIYVNPDGSVKTTVNTSGHTRPILVPYNKQEQIDNKIEGAKGEYDLIAGGFYSSGNSEGLQDFSKKYNLSGNTEAAIVEMGETHTASNAKSQTNYFNYLNDTKESLKEKLKAEAPILYASLKTSRALDAYVENDAKEIVQNNYLTEIDFVTTNDVYNQGDQQLDVYQKGDQKLVLEGLDKMDAEPATFMLNNNAMATVMTEGTNIIEGTAAASFADLVKSGGINFEQQIKYELAAETELQLVGWEDVAKTKAKWEKVPTGKTIKQPYVIIDGKRMNIERDKIRFTHNTMPGTGIGHKYVQRFTLNDPGKKDKDGNYIKGSEPQKVVWDIVQEGKNVEIGAAGRNLNALISNPQKVMENFAAETLQSAEQTVSKFQRQGSTTGMKLPQFKADVTLGTKGGVNGSLQYYLNGTEIKGNLEQQKSVVAAMLLNEQIQPTLTK